MFNLTNSRPLFLGRQFDSVGAKRFHHLRGRFGDVDFRNRDLRLKEAQGHRGLVSHVGIGVVQGVPERLDRTLILGLPQG